MKVALILAGPYRGSQSIIQSHYDFIGEYDTYVSCLGHYKIDWENSNWNIKKIYITPFIDIKSTNWFEYRDDGAGQSGFWQFWNLKSVINNTPNEYDFYIKSRSDLNIESKLDIDFSKLDKKTLYSSAHSFHKGSWDGYWLNDEFYIGSKYVMNIIANFVTDYYKTPNRHTLNAAEPTGVGSNENSLRNFLEENGIKIDKIYNLKYSKNNNGINVPSGYVKFQLEKI
jgi:hypothetical protein